MVSQVTNFIECPSYVFRWKRAVSKDFFLNVWQMFSCFVWIAKYWYAHYKVSWNLSHLYRWPNSVQLKAPSLGRKMLISSMRKTPEALRLSTINMYPRSALDVHSTLAVHVWVGRSLWKQQDVSVVTTDKQAPHTMECLVIALRQ